MFFVRALKLIHAQRVGTDQKHLLLDEENAAIQTGSVGRKDLIFGPAVALLIEVQQGVV